MQLPQDGVSSIQVVRSLAHRKTTRFDVAFEVLVGAQSCAGESILYLIACGHQGSEQFLQRPVNRPNRPKLVRHRLKHVDSSCDSVDLVVGRKP